MSYALLVLPAADPEITPPVLEKSAILSKAALPFWAISQRARRACRITRLRSKGDRAGTGNLGRLRWAKVTEHALGDGKIVDGVPLADLLAAMKLPPDFSCGDPVKKRPVPFHSSATG